MRGIHGRVMLESVAADEPHQFLQLGNVHDGTGAECRKRIVGETSLSDVRPDAAVVIVGRNTPESDRPLRRTTGEGAIRVLLAERRAQDRSRGDGDIRQERLCPVAAVEEDALVRVVAVIVVPIDERARPAGRQL